MLIALSLRRNFSVNMKTVAPFLCLLLIYAAWAGTWAISPWTNDASTCVASPQTAWAYHLGAIAAATVNSVISPGLAGGVSPLSAAGQFSVTGLASFVANGTNALTGTGSAVMENDFIHGGNRGTVQGGHHMFSAATHLITPAL